MTYEDMHIKANMALVSISREMFVDVPVELEELMFLTIEALTKVTPKTKSLIIITSIMLRVMQEIHATRQLLGLGYPVQGMSLAANTVEMLADIAYISNDETIAERWDSHLSLEKNVWERPESIKFRLKSGLITIGIPEVEAIKMSDDIYGTYSTLCAAKHANPMLQKTVGGVFEGDTLIPGPQDYSIEPDKNSALLAMHAVTRMSSLAARIVLQQYVGKAKGEAIDEAAVTILDKSFKIMNNVLGKS